MILFTKELLISVELNQQNFTKETTFGAYMTNVVNPFRRCIIHLKNIKNLNHWAAVRFILIFLWMHVTRRQLVKQTWKGVHNNGSEKTVERIVIFVTLLNISFKMPKKAEQLIILPKVVYLNEHRARSRYRQDICSGFIYSVGVRFCNLIMIFNNSNLFEVNNIWLKYLIQKITFPGCNKNIKRNNILLPFI